MITDKLGRLVKINDRIAIAQLRASDNNIFKIQGTLSFATVLYIGNEYLKIKYDIGNLDDCFVNKEFIIFTEDNVYSMIENATFNLVGL